MEVGVKKKAELIETGGVVIDRTFRPYVSRATAGPGAGLESIFVNIDGHRVRLGVRQASRFRASLDGNEVTIYSNDDGVEREFVRGKLEEAISHTGEAWLRRDKSPDRMSAVYWLRRVAGKGHLN